MNELELKKNHELTERLAYELWERRGCPVGSPEVDWFAAETTLAFSQQAPEAEEILEKARAASANS